MVGVCGSPPVAIGIRICLGSSRALTGRCASATWCRASSTSTDAVKTLFSAGTLGCEHGAQFGYIPICYEALTVARL